MYSVESQKCESKIESLNQANSSLHTMSQFQIDIESEILTLRQAPILKEMESALQVSILTLKSLQEPQSQDGLHDV